MKIKSALIGALLFFSTLLSAQLPEHALGLRFNGDHEIDGRGAEISYQHGFNSLNRGELNLGFRNSGHVDAIKLTGIYQWVWNLEGNFNWYAGVGANLGLVEHNDHWHGHGHHDHDGDGTNILLAGVGDIGIEYAFTEVPIQLAFDVRPEFYVLNYYGNFLNVDLGLAVRWQFR